MSELILLLHRAREKGERKLLSTFNARAIFQPTDLDGNLNKHFVISSSSQTSSFFSLTLPLHFIIFESFMLSDVREMNQWGD